jgi:hypothetical protein
MNVSAQDFDRLAQEHGQPSVVTASKASQNHSRHRTPAEASYSVTRQSALLPRGRNVYFWDTSHRTGIEQIVACPQFAPALDQFQRSEPTQGIVETAAVRFVASLGRHFLFAQRIGITLRECF